MSIRRRHLRAALCIAVTGGIVGATAVVAGPISSAVAEPGDSAGSNADLNVTVGKNLLVTTDASGAPSLKMLLSGTQASGTGERTVEVPMATTSAKSSNSFSNPQMQGDSILYDISNLGQQQQLLEASNSSYEGEPPIKVQVEAWHDGESIAPADLVNVNGKVRVRYTFTNTTAQPTEITYKDPNGNVVETTEQVPTPIGGVVTLTLPPTFADINAPWAQSGINSTGTTLGGSLILFPPIGETTQSLTIEATAKDGTWPGAQVQAFPVNLKKDSSIGRLAFKYADDASGIADEFYASGLTAQADLSKYQALMLYYYGIVERINQGLVQPLVRGVKADAPQLLRIIDELGPFNKNAQDMGPVFPAAAASVGDVNSDVKAAYRKALALEQQVLSFSRNELPGLNNLVQEANTFIPQSGLGGIINQLQHFPAWFANTGTVCTSSGTGSPQQIYYNLYIYPLNSKPYVTGPSPAPYGTGSLDDALTQLPNGATKTALQGMRDQYHTLLTTSAIDALVTTGGFSTPLWLTAPGSLVDGVNAVLGTPYATAACPTFLTNSTMTELNTDLQNPTYLRYLTDAQEALTRLPSIASEVQAWTDSSKKLANEFQRVNRMVNNPNCPQTATGIKKCGAIQQLAYLQSGLASGGEQINSSLIPGTEKLAKAAPRARHYVELAAKYAATLGSEAAGAPHKIESYANELGLYGTKTAAGIETLGSAEETAAKTIAFVEAMDARTQAGDGMPAGPATGSNAQLAAYEYQINGASGLTRIALIRLVIGALLLVITIVTVGVIASRRRKRAAASAISGTAQMAAGANESVRAHPARPWAVVVAISIAVGLIALLTGGVTSGHATPTEAAANKQNLNVTVSKDVTVNTDASGNPTIAQLHAYTQVTGTGSDVVKVPMGTDNPKSRSSFGSPKTVDDAAVYDLKNSQSQVQLMQASNNKYSDKLPINVRVDALLDGNPIDPADLTNVTGEVTVKYTITNTTSQDTSISYKDAQGALVTKTVPVPMPFGAAFELTLPPGFADVNAPWASAAVKAEGLTPTGTSLAGDLMLFPPVGDTTQTLTVQARADSATWPEATITATPITLSTNAAGKLAFEYGPEAGSYAQEAYTYGVTGQTDIAKYQALALKYQQKLIEINNQKVEPYVRDVEQGRPQVQEAITSLNSLDSGVEKLSNQLPAAIAGVNEIAADLNEASAEIATKTPEIRQYLADLVSANDQVQTLYRWLKTPGNEAWLINLVSSTFTPANITNLKNASQLLTAVCSYGLNTMLYKDPATRTSWDQVLQNAINQLPSGSTQSYLTQIKADLDGYASGSGNPAAVAGCSNLEQEIISPASNFASTYGAQIVPWLQGFLPQLEHYAVVMDQITQQAVQLVRTELPLLTSELATGSAEMKTASRELSSSLAAVNTQMVPEANALVGQIPFFTAAYNRADQYAPLIENTIAGIPAELGGVAKDLGVFNPLAAIAANTGIEVGDYVNENLAIMEAMNQRALAGDGIPAGPATGATTQLSSFNYTVSGGDDDGRQGAIKVGLSLLILLIGVVLATVFHIRNRNTEVD